MRPPPRAAPASDDALSDAKNHERVLRTRRGDLRLPVFVPDATRGRIHSVPTSLLPAAGVEAVLVSTAHLAVQPGASVIRAAGGIHSFMGWAGPVLSDSGGFQVFSLLGARARLASVSDRGLSYRFSEKQKFRLLTPASCIEAQLRIGSDIVYCLDYCTHPNAPRGEQERSVELTIDWARQCRTAFDRLAGEDRPLLFAVVQGGRNPDLRARCAEDLAAIGFDGYGFGGYPIVEGTLTDEVALVAELLPPDSVLHGLGIGTPDNLAAAVAAGYSVFDCTLPTRNARRGVLYVALDGAALGGKHLFGIARLGDERWVRHAGPLDASCDCQTCGEVPAAYLAHLHRIDDPLAATLASVHNLRFYARLVEVLRATSR